MVSDLRSWVHPRFGYRGFALLILSSALITGGVPTLHAQQNSTPAGPGPVFRRVATYSTEGLFSDSVGVGDFNGDGKLDLVVTNQCTGILPGFCENGFATVTARLGNGNGTFGRAVNSLAGNGLAFSMVVGDFNHDGKPDLGVASLCVNDFVTGLIGEVHGFVGNGDGTFDSFYAWPTAGPCPYSVTIGDFNLDGNLDLAVTYFCTGNDSVPCTDGLVGVFLGLGNGNFQDPAFYPSGGPPRSIRVGDFNGDGNPDLAIGDGFFGGPETVGVLSGNGDGTFQMAAPFAFSVDFVVADFNGDGRSDLVGASGNNLALLLGNEDGSFQPAITINATPGALAAADFNGDGKLDLAVLGPDGITVLLGNGHGEFHAFRGGDGMGGTLAVAVGDFNNDGKPDLAVDDGSRVTVLLNVYRSFRHETRD